LSFEAAAWAIKQSPGTPTDKLVLIALSDCFNKYNSRCDPSNIYLAKRAMCDVRYITESIKRLEAADFIRVQRRSGRRNSYALSKYELDMEQPGADDSNLTPADSSGVSKSTPDASSGEPLRKSAKTPALSSGKPIKTHKKKPTDGYGHSTSENPPPISPEQELRHLEKMLGWIKEDDPNKPHLEKQAADLRRWIWEAANA